MSKPLLNPPPRLNLRPQPHRARPWRTIGRLLAVLLALALAWIGYLLAFNKGFRQTVPAMVSGTNPKAAFGQDAITLLVLGRDEDRDHRKRVLDTDGRTDTIILVRLDFDAKRIDMLSIPRDTRVRVPGTRGYHKINAAHAIGGWPKTAETIQAFLGVASDRVFVVDYDMLRRVIDALGGVTVTVDKELNYDDNWGDLHIHLKPGEQRLNGTQAMGFVRFRHSNDGKDDSDLVRIERQQALLHAVRSELKHPGAWLRMPRVLETVRRNMRGNLTYPQLVALAGFARGVPPENIRSHTMPSRMGRSWVYPDLPESRRLAARLFPSAPAAAITMEGELPRPTRRAPAAAPRPTAIAPAAEGTPPPPAMEEVEPSLDEEPEPIIVDPAPSAVDDTTVPQASSEAPDQPSATEPAAPA